MTSILRKKNCLITGATGGLGGALARQLAESGANLFLVGRNTDKLFQLNSELGQLSNVSIYCSECDISKENEIYESVAEATEKLGHIDILINSAGTFPVGDAVEMSIKNFRAFWKKILFSKIN